MIIVDVKMSAYIKTPVVTWRIITYDLVFKQIVLQEYQYKLFVHYLYSACNITNISIAIAQIYWMYEYQLSITLHWLAYPDNSHMETYNLVTKCLNMRGSTVRVSDVHIWMDMKC